MQKCLHLIFQFMRLLLIVCRKTETTDVSVLKLLMKMINELYTYKL